MPTEVPVKLVSILVMVPLVGCKGDPTCRDVANRAYDFTSNGTLGGMPLKDKMAPFRDSIVQAGEEQCTQARATPAELTCMNQAANDDAFTSCGAVSTKIVSAVRLGAFAAARSDR
jgi:hypothetical protein